MARNNNLKTTFRGNAVSENGKYLNENRPLCGISMSQK